MVCVDSNKSEEDKEINDYFLLCKKELIRILGDKVTTGRDLDNVASQIFKKKWKGVYSWDKLPLEPGYYIVNLDHSRDPGSHWVAIGQTPGSVFIWDSFGRCLNTIMPKLIKKIINQGKTVWESDSDKEQFGSSEICGPLSIAALMCMKHFGSLKTFKYL
jgi:hypothetical protein